MRFRQSYLKTGLALEIANEVIKNFPSNWERFEDQLEFRRHEDDEDPIILCEGAVPLLLSNVLEIQDMVGFDEFNKVSKCPLGECDGARFDGTVMHPAPAAAVIVRVLLQHGVQSIEDMDYDVENDRYTTIKSQDLLNISENSADQDMNWHSAHAYTYTEKDVWFDSRGEVQI